MSREGPPLERLTRRLAECPADFLPGAAGGAQPPAVAAVVGDLLRDLGESLPEPRRLESFRKMQASVVDQKKGNEARLVLVAAWLLHDRWFLGRRGLDEPARRFLEFDLGSLARLVQAERFVDDPDRREELARRALAALELEPLGETPARARDRLATLDSVERAAVLEKTRAAEERARQVREAMARKAAAEAAASYGRE